MDTEMTRYESFAEVTEDFYCSAVDVLKILVLRLHDYHVHFPQGMEQNTGLGLHAIFSGDHQDGPI